MNIPRCTSASATLETSGLFLFRKEGHPAPEGLDQYVDLPPFDRNKHLKLMIEDKYVTTSIGFVIVKRSAG